jgi:hypothetical protein
VIAGIGFDFARTNRIDHPTEIISVAGRDCGYQVKSRAVFEGMIAPASR